MKIAVSACLLGNNVKYNGGNNRNIYVLSLTEGQHVLSLCPEAAGGLPTPRVPSEVQGKSSEVQEKSSEVQMEKYPRMVLSRDGRDVTEEFYKGARECFEILRKEQPDLVILKANSPSCGIHYTYDGSFSHVLTRRGGIFGEMVKEAGISVMDEKDLKNATFPEAFLDRQNVPKEERTYEGLCRRFRLPMDIAETKRLLIRELSPWDIGELQAVYHEPHVTDYVEGLFPEEEEILYQKNYRKHVYGVFRFGMWALIEKESGRLIGRAGLEWREGCAMGEAELGYVLGSSYWHQGYAMEACEKIISLAPSFGITALRARIHPDNEASLKLANRLGFLRNGDEMADEEEVYVRRL